MRPSEFLCLQTSRACWQRSCRASHLHSVAKCCWNCLSAWRRNAASGRCLLSGLGFSQPGLPLMPPVLGRRQLSQKRSTLGLRAHSAEPTSPCAWCQDCIVLVSLQHSCQSWW